MVFSVFFKLQVLNFQKARTHTMNSITLSRGGTIVANLMLGEAPVTIGRKYAILKRKTRDGDLTIPRVAASLDVDPSHAGTLVLTNIHDKIDFEFELPDESATVCLRASESTSIPSGIVLWKDIVLRYRLPSVSIWSQETDDGDVTDDDDYHLGGESQPNPWDAQTQA